MQISVFDLRFLICFLLLYCSDVVASEVINEITVEWGELEQVLLLQKQNELFQYVVGLLSFLSGIFLAFVFLSGLKLR